MLRHTNGHHAFQGCVRGAVQVGNIAHKPRITLHRGCHASHAIDGNSGGRRRGVDRVCDRHNRVGDIVDDRVRYRVRVVIGRKPGLAVGNAAIIQRLLVQTRVRRTRGPDKFIHHLTSYGGHDNGLNGMGVIKRVG